MKSLSFLTALLLCSVLVIPATAQKGKPPAIDLKGKTVKQVFEELLPGMGGKDLAARHGPQQQWQAVCVQAGAPGNEKMRAEVCQLMVGKLDPQTPNPARIWLLKQLEVLGRAESVNAVAAVLDDKDDLVRDAAVRCLANNPAPEANAKLLAALPASSGKAKIGLVNALGYRADPTSVSALAKELTSVEAGVSSATARALGKIATPEAAKLLADARQDAKGPAQLWIADAYLLCADRRLKEGKKTEAAAMYKELHGAEEPPSIRLAALQGVLRTVGDEAGAMILEIISGKDADARTIAIGQIEAISPGALKSLATNMDKLPANGQVLLLGALATRGDKAQLPVAVAAAQSKDESIQRAGISALGRLGDASVVPLLVEALLGSTKLSGPARDSLTALTGAGVNEKIVAALQAEKTPGKRVALIAMLEARRAAAAVPALLAEARGDDAAVRAAAMLALRQLAEPKDVPALVQALLKADKGKERTEAELTILAVCNRIVEPEKRADPVLPLLADDKVDRVILLPLLGRLGGPRALETIKAELTSNTPELRAAAVQGICNWPDAAVSEELLKLAQGAGEPQHRLLALHNLVRVNALPSEQSTAPRLAMMKKALELSARDEDRRVVLDGLATVKDIETLRYVLPYLDRKELTQSACRTIVELAHSRTLREPNQAEFVRALDRVIALCKDKGLIERAKKYKQEG